LTEFLNGSKSTELDNSFHMMTKLKVKNPTWELKLWAISTKVKFKSQNQWSLATKK
jgi:hypothetical protein